MVGLGDDAVFTVGVTGSPSPQLQWYDGNNKIVGATSSRLVIPAVTLDDVRCRRIKVVAKNKVEVTSRVVEVLLKDPLPYFPAYGNLPPTVDLEEGGPLVLSLNGTRNSHAHGVDMGENNVRENARGGNGQCE